MSYYPSLPTIYPYRGMVYHILDIILTANFSESPAVVARDNLAALLWIDRTQADVHRIALPSLREAVRRYLATS